MGVFLFIVILLIVLLILIIIGSIQNLALWCTTRQNHEFVYMLVPALLSSLLFAVTIIITYFGLKLFNIDTLAVIYSMIMKFQYNFNNYMTIIISYIISAFLFIVLQSLCLKLSNINYGKIYNCIKSKIKSLKKEKEKKLESANDKTNITNEEEHTTLPVAIEESKNISFFYAFSASLFTFAICFFSSLLLFYIGTLIGKSYII